LIFDRRRDVSKLIGCNTRNVKYRWQLFSAHLLALKARFDHPRAIDFGAGSLRDSYELSREGYAVVAVDLEETTIKRYFESYDWQSCPSSPRLFTHGLATLSEQEPDRSFHLVIAFDVLEHLENPETYLRRFQRLLHPEGYLFSIVPNKRSIFETYFRRSLRRQRSKGAVLKPGVPHLQFKTPTEWARYFEANGFKIIEHDMAIGFLVNDCWNGLLGLPIRTYVSPVIELLAYRLHLNVNTAALESAFSPAWLMERVNHWDEILKPQLKHRFGWNLIVAQPVAVDSTEA
jgi:2-polyprenyl-3-methyl-5-hydroxy-6-metoxy-1,4-benzoquinol methylase